MKKIIYLILDLFFEKTRSRQLTEKFYDLIDLEEDLQAYKNMIKNKEDHVTFSNGKTLYITQ